MTVSVQCVKTVVMLTIIAAASCYQVPRMKVANTPMPPMNWTKHPSCPLMSVVTVSTT